MLLPIECVMQPGDCVPGFEDGSFWLWTQQQVALFLGFAWVGCRVFRVWVTFSTDSAKLCTPASISMHTLYGWKSKRQVAAGFLDTCASRVSVNTIYLPH